MKPEYEQIITEVEGILQDYIGKIVAPSLELNGWEVTILTNPYPEFSTPIRFSLIVDPVNEDNDDSDQAFEEANGYEAVYKWLDGLGLQDGRVMIM